MKPDSPPFVFFRKLFGSIDFGSLKLRLWGYFGLFAVILVVVLWVLQVVFLNYYYEGSKQRETQRIVQSIEGQFRTGEPLADIRSYVTQIYRESGIFIQIEPADGFAIVIPNVNFYESSDDVDAAGNEIEGLSAERPGSFYPTVYRNEIDNLKTQLIESREDFITKQTIEPETARKTLEFAVWLNGVGENYADNLILFVFSPLFPQESTQQILMEQLLYVTIIAVLLSLLLGFYLSRMITKPLEEITERAEDLASGKYGIDFSVAHYSEIMRLADTLSAASNELAEKHTMQRDIIANVSHDLKTPLTMIRSYAEMIGDLSGDNPQKRAEHLQVIIEETDRLSVMIGELLDISKLQSGELTVNRTTFSMKDLIQNTINAYKGYMDHGGNPNLIFEGSGEGIVDADEVRIKQVLDNLISNALKYGGKNKAVEIRMFEGEESLRVEVVDHGIGISKRDLRYVWDRYYQASAHHSRSDSTGLGLSIVKEILVLHGAKFGAESAIRQGSTFWFEIPVKAKDMEG